MHHTGKEELYRIHQRCTRQMILTHTFRLFATLLKKKPDELPRPFLLFRYFWSGRWDSQQKKRGSWKWHPKWSVESRNERPNWSIMASKLRKLLLSWTRLPRFTSSTFHFFFSVWVMCVEGAYCLEKFKYCFDCTIVVYWPGNLAFCKRFMLTWLKNVFSCSAHSISNTSPRKWWTKCLMDTPETRMIYRITRYMHEMNPLWKRLTFGIHWCKLLGDEK